MSAKELRQPSLVGRSRTLVSAGPAQHPCHRPHLKHTSLGTVYRYKFRPGGPAGLKIHYRPGFFLMQIPFILHGPCACAYKSPNMSSYNLPLVVHSLVSQKRETHRTCNSLVFIYLIDLPQIGHIRLFIGPLFEKLQYTFPFVIVVCCFPSL